MGAILLVIVPLQVIAAGVTWAVAPEQLEWNSSTSSGEDPDLLLWQGIVALIGFVTLLLVTAMSLKAVADARLGGTPSGGRALRFALPRLPGTLGVAVLGGLAVALGFLALIVPGIWLIVGFSVAVPVLLLERDRAGRGAAALAQARLRALVGDRGRAAPRPAAGRARRRAAPGHRDVDPGERLGGPARSRRARHGARRHDRHGLHRALLRRRS